MSPITNALVNLWRLLRNAFVRLLRRPPDHVWIEASGPLPEFETPVGFLRRRFLPGPAPPSLERLRERLDRISADGRPRGVVLRVRGLDAGWTAIEELRRELRAFRERGGRVVAYLTEADSRSYYLACAADEILATPLATVNVIGVRTRVNFLRDALNRVGLEAEVVAVSPFSRPGILSSATTSPPSPAGRRSASLIAATRSSSARSRRAGASTRTRRAPG